MSAQSGIYNSEWESQFSPLSPTLVGSPLLRVVKHVLDLRHPILPESISIFNKEKSLNRESLSSGVKLFLKDDQPWDPSFKSPLDQAFSFRGLPYSWFVSESNVYNGLFYNPLPKDKTDPFDSEVFPNLSGITVEYFPIYVQWSGLINLLLSPSDLIYWTMLKTKEAEIILWDLNTRQLSGSPLNVISEVEHVRLQMSSFLMALFVKHLNPKVF